MVNLNVLYSARDICEMSKIIRIQITSLMLLKLKALLRRIVLVVIVVVVVVVAVVVCNDLTYSYVTLFRIKRPSSRVGISKEVLC